MRSRSFPLVALAGVWAVGCATAEGRRSGGGGSDVDGGQSESRPDAGYIRPIDAGPGGIDASNPVGGNCSTAVNFLTNGDFDIGPGGMWAETSGAPENYPLVVDTDDLSPAGLSPDTGAYAVWLGGYLAGFGGSASDILSQNISVPVGATSLQLTGMRVVGSEEPSGVYDTLEIQITTTDGIELETMATWSNQDDGDGSWEPFTLSASGSYSGQAVRLTFSATFDDFNNTNFFLDTLSLVTTSCN